MDQLAQWARQVPDRVAAHFPDLGVAIRFDELDARANRAAQWLIALGLEPGDGIALMLENRPEFLELAFACRRAGLYYTPLSIPLRPHEVAYVLADSGAKLLVASPVLEGLAEALLREGAIGDRIRVAVGEGLAGYQSYEEGLARFPAVAALPERDCRRASAARWCPMRTGMRPNGT